MSKIAINNEVVLMRHAVRKSRVSVVRKLIKESKLLRARKHGDEKIVEKCKRKAEKLAAEIEALKKIKDDEISKFGITLTKQLPEILGDATADPNTRAMARLAFHKFLSERIRQFKEKFPAYEEHLGPGRKKWSKLQRKANREAINRIRAGGETTAENNDENEALKSEIQLAEGKEDGNEVQEDEIAHSDENDESVDDKINESAEEDEMNNESADTKWPEPDQEPGSILRIKKPKSSKKRKNDVQSESEKSDISEAESESEKSKKSKIIMDDSVETKKSKIISKLSKPKKSILPMENPVELKKPKINTKNSVEPKKSKIITKDIEKPKKSISTKVISEEASVKRFTDLIEDQESSEIVKSINPTNSRKEVKLEKQIDSFFMTANGENEYMSVVVPKSKLCEEEEQDDRFAPNHGAKRQKNFHEKNNKFFSKIDQRSNQDYSNKFAPNTDKRRQNNFGNSNNPSDKYNRNGNNFMKNSRYPKPEFEKKNDVKDEELHPSWQARKKQQEILKQGFQGKKIVFDD